MISPFCTAKYVLCCFAFAQLKISMFKQLCNYYSCHRIDHGVYKQLILMASQTIGNHYCRTALHGMFATHCPQSLQKDSPYTMQLGEDISNTGHTSTFDERHPRFNTWQIQYPVYCDFRVVAYCNLPVTGSGACSLTIISRPASQQPHACMMREYTCKDPRLVAAFWTLVSVFAALQAADS